MQYFSNVSFCARYKNPPIYCPLLPAHTKGKKPIKVSLIHIQVKMSPFSCPPCISIELAAKHKGTPCPFCFARTI